MVLNWARGTDEMKTPARLFGEPCWRERDPSIQRTRLPHAARRGEHLAGTARHRFARHAVTVRSMRGLGVHAHVNHVVAAIARLMAEIHLLRGRLLRHAKVEAVIRAV